MATGDKADQLSRLKRLLPPWFADANPIRDAVLTGIAGTQAFLYDMIAFARLQTRIRTATGGWLDLIAVDFFGADAVRGAGQSDASLRSEILVNLFRERATRAGLEKVLLDLTGNEPAIFEPARVQDAGAYGAPSRGYGVAGGYGSLRLPFQAFVTARLPAGSGIPKASGYRIPAGGYGAPSRLEYASLDMVTDAVRDTDVYAAVDGVKPIATTVWVKIGNGTSQLQIVPDFSLIVGGKPVRIGSAGAHIRLLGLNL
jgi:hypothetical protein